MFDLVFTYSSVEHSGLGEWINMKIVPTQRVELSHKLHEMHFLSGRYGDPLNPWGDIITIAQAWCASTEDVWTNLFRILTKISNGLFFAARSVQMYCPLDFPMQARLVLGVPTDVQKRDGSPGRDTIQFNVHRWHRWQHRWHRWPLKCSLPNSPVWADTYFEQSAPLVLNDPSYIGRLSAMNKIRHFARSFSPFLAKQGRHIFFSTFCKKKC